MKNNRKVVFQEKFKIPQIDSKYDGLKKEKPKFNRTVAASPFFGTRVKDTIVVPDTKGKINIDLAYDSFREEDKKRVSEEELIKKYGTKYYDFQILNEDKRKESLGVQYKEDKDEIKEELKVIEEEKVKEEVKPHVSGIFRREVKDNIVRPSLNLNFNFDDDEENEEPDVVKKEEKVENYKNEDFNETVEEEHNVVELGPDYSDYKLPPLSIFKHQDNVSDEVPQWLIEKKETINQILTDFDVDGEVVNYTKGPAFTRYEIMLQSGVKVNKVSQLYENFQMGLGAKSIRILAPIPGKKTVGIEVPNEKTEMVYFGDLVDEDFVNDNRPLKVAFGKNIDGEVIRKAIDDMPHCLVAGATKSGKSVCMNTMLISLLIKNKPDDLKLILVDPKKVELSFYEELPHLVTPVITDPEMASFGLKWAVDEMERRYDMLSSMRVRNIEDYNRKASFDGYKTVKKMPYIVIIIDELADLMMTCSSDVEDSIKRITQKARAAGIHLIVATQRPSVQVVSGNIKANIPSRIAFRVSSFVDSNTILDEAGAETLLGKGDMLIKDNDAPERVQGAFISDDEINDVCDFIRKEAKPDYIFTHQDLQKQIDGSKESSMTFGKDAFEPDSVLYEVGKFCVEHGSGSINLIQSNFNFGFNRSQRIVSMLEARGVLGPKLGGTKGREVLVDYQKLDEIFNRE